MTPDDSGGIAIEPEYPAQVPTAGGAVPLGLRDVVVRRGSRTILDAVTAEFTSGVTGLLGLNGAGKTSLLHTAAGVLRPDVGRVAVGGHDPYRRGERAEALASIALVPQEFDFPRHLRLREFLVYMAFLRAVPAAQRDASAEAAATTVGLTDRLGDRLRTLSGGMQRRALVAQAILAEPQVLLFDESTSGLDPQQRAQLRDLVAELGQTRCCVFASHIVEDIDLLANRVVVLHEGRVLHDGPRTSLLASASDSDAHGGGGSALERAFLSLIRAG